MNPLSLVGIGEFSNICSAFEAGIVLSMATSAIFWRTAEWRHMILRVKFVGSNQRNGPRKRCQGGLISIVWVTRMARLNSNASPKVLSVCVDRRRMTELKSTWEFPQVYISETYHRHLAVYFVDTESKDSHDCVCVLVGLPAMFP